MKWVNEEIAVDNEEHVKTSLDQLTSVVVANVVRLIYVAKKQLLKKDTLFFVLCLLQKNNNITITKNQAWTERQKLLERILRRRLALASMLVG